MQNWVEELKRLVPTNYDVLTRQPPRPVRDRRRPRRRRHGRGLSSADTKLGVRSPSRSCPRRRADAERLARFQREAKTLAALNHPNIAQIYGLERGEWRHALVMELVEGDDLSQRIARGAIPLDEALPIARQIAEALEAAHEQGIIHRDLKPANIKVRPDGDGEGPGLRVGEDRRSGWRARSPTSTSDATASPTITSPAMMTGVGVILGTAAYMSPEQAKGREADKRSDIWAFGCVLYEMLTGRRAFDGDDVSDALANGGPARTRVVGPPLGDSPRRFGRCCRAVSSRIAGVAWPTSPRRCSCWRRPPASRHPPARIAAPLPRKPLWQRVVTPVAAALVASAVVGTAVWFGTRPIPPRMARFPLTNESAAALSLNGIDRDLAVTPDGSRVVYVGRGSAEILMRPLDQVEPIGCSAVSPAVSSWLRMGSGSALSTTTGR